MDVKWNFNIKFKLNAIIDYNNKAHFKSHLIYFYFCFCFCVFWMENNKLIQIYNNNNHELLPLKKRTKSRAWAHYYSLLLFTKGARERERKKKRGKNVIAFENNNRAKLDIFLILLKANTSASFFHNQIQMGYHTEWDVVDFFTIFSFLYFCFCFHFIIKWRAQATQ